jgi:DNA-binding response OmpR family regulator
MMVADTLPDVPEVPPKRRILIVEDSEMARKALACLLEHYGHEVLTAGSVAEARKHLATHPQHVLLDLALPDGKGEDLLAEIRKANLPCAVTVTTGSGIERIRSLLPLKPDQVLVKPVDFLRLLEKLNKPAA